MAQARTIPAIVQHRNCCDDYRESLLAKAWTIVPAEHFSFVTCALVMLLATIGLLTKTKEVPSKALYAALPSYAALLVALDIIIHKS